MGNEATNISETFKANETTRQFELTDKFESFAKIKWLNEQSIKSARAEIEDRFAKFNKEGMDARRFGNLKRTIDGMVENEIGKAMSALRNSSTAMQGVPVVTETAQAPGKIPANTPGITNTPSRENGQTVTGALNAIPVVRSAIAERKKQLDSI